MSPNCNHSPIMLYGQIFEHASSDEIVIMNMSTMFHCCTIPTFHITMCTFMYMYVVLLHNVGF